MASEVSGEALSVKAFPEEGLPMVYGKAFLGPSQSEGASDGKAWEGRWQTSRGWQAEHCGSEGRWQPSQEGSSWQTRKAGSWQRGGLLIPGVY